MVCLCPLHPEVLHLRSTNRHLLAVQRFRLNISGRMAFSVAAPMAWISVPDLVPRPCEQYRLFQMLTRTWSESS